MYQITPRVVELRRKAHRKEDPLQKLAPLIGIGEDELVFRVIMLKEQSISTAVVGSSKSTRLCKVKQDRSRLENLEVVPGSVNESGNTSWHIA
jgi:hypothetical protein